MSVDASQDGGEEILRSSLLSSLWSEAAIAINYSKQVGAKGAVSFEWCVGEVKQQQRAACWHLREPSSEASFLGELDKSSLNFNKPHTEQLFSSDK
ncbi:hypothetical protein E3U43_007565%2C partial, partial [Xyrichtys novacula]